VIDPKGGMELAAGQRLYTEVCYGDDDTDEEGKRRAHEFAYAEFLERAVHIMRERQRRFRGVVRTHKATADDPHIVIVIDELASLTAYVVDRHAAKRIEAALNLLLSQGRACGVTIVAALQDPRKDVLPARGLFPTRIALRMNEPDEVDMVLGPSSYDKGARCDEISEELPGVGFVTVEGRTEPIRLRFAYVDDDEIATAASLYAPGSITAPTLDDELADLIASQGGSGERS
jgi:S-DNA-T family DNA segregation ATPase FtsK/SpoIIIE